MIRRQMIARRKTISPSEKQRLDQAIHNNLLDRPEWRRAKTICIYVSLLQEVDTRSLISTSLQQQKSIIVPEKRHEETHITDVDLFIVPGIAFDPKGYRLGWGKGYYDRLLTGVKAIKIGLAYSFQIVPRLPHKKYDIPMDIVITEAGIVIPAEEPGSSQDKTWIPDQVRNDKKTT